MKKATLLPLFFLLVACTPNPQITATAQANTQPPPQGGVTPQSITQVAPPSSPAVQKEGGVFSMGVVDEPGGFNPLLNSGTTELYVFGFNSEPLSWGGENYPTQTKPILAESWEISENKLYWTIHLRQGVLWHDGTTLQAEDVVNWAETIQDPLTQGAEWYAPRFFDDNGTPFQFEAVDKYTVRVSTSTPVPDLIKRISLPLTPSYYFLSNNISHDQLKSDSFNTEGNIGSGPFKFGKYIAGEAVMLERFDPYWRGKPYLDSVILRIYPNRNALIGSFAANEIDWAWIEAQEVPRLINNPNLRFYAQTIDSGRSIDLNTYSSLLADRRTRQALFISLDRQKMINLEELGYGVIADSPFSPLVNTYEPLTPYEYDINLAQQMLSEVGWVKAKDGILNSKQVEGIPDGRRFSLNVIYFSDNDPLVAIVQEAWSKLGIEIILKKMDYQVYMNENAGNSKKPDAAITYIQWLGSEAGAYRRLYAAGSFADSRSGYYSPEVEELFRLAENAASQEEADQAYRQAARLLWDDLPTLPLFWRQWVFAASRRLHVEEAGLNPLLFSVFERPEKLWVEH